MWICKVYSRLPPIVVAYAPRHTPGFTRGYSQFYKGNFAFPIRKRNRVFRYFKYHPSHKTERKGVCLSIGYEPGGWLRVWLGSDTYQQELARFRAEVYMPQEALLLHKEYVAPEAYIEQMYQALNPAVQAYMLEHRSVSHDHWDTLGQRYDYGIVIDSPLVLKTIRLQYINKEVEQLAHGNERSLSNKAIVEKIIIGEYVAKTHKDTRVSLNFDEKEMLAAFSDLQSNQGGGICLHIDLKQDGTPNLKLYNMHKSIDLKQFRIYY